MCDILVKNLTALYEEEEIEVEDCDEVLDFKDVCWDPIKEVEVSDAVKGLKIKKAPGIDGICSEMIVGSTPTQVEAFLKVFNNVLGGEYPWKNDVKIPIYKKGGRVDPDKYRFIGIQVIFRKLFNKILENRMKTFVKLDPWQSSFQKNKRGSDNFYALHEVLRWHAAARRKN